MSSIKLSIIVPVYNVEDYLLECINSILQQTFRNYELILVDDGSTDRSGLICDEYAKKDCRIEVCHKENGGVSSARNAGLAIAKGELLTFVDPDDFINENTYSRNIEIMKTCKEIDILQFPCVLYPSYTSYGSSERRKIEGSKDILENWWTGDILTFSMCHKIFRKQFFDGVTFLEHHVSEDTRLIVNFYKRAQCVYISDVGCYYYRKNGNSQTAHYTFDKHIDLFDAHLLIYKEMLKYPSLACRLPIAYERLLRRLIQAVKLDNKTNIDSRYAEVDKVKPTWKEVLTTNSVSMWLLLAKMMKTKHFVFLNVHKKH